MRLAAALTLIAAPALAASEKVWPGTHASNFVPSVVALHAPTRADAAASLTFQNTRVHHRDETFTLEWGGIEVLVEFDWDASGSAAERVTVFPPPGYIAIPPEITVGEDETQTLHIIKWIGG